MKKELKTLKDFEREQYSEGDEEDGSIVKYFDERELKAEAVKWLKAKDDGETMPLYSEDWIKHFFNLTEEDLK